VREPGVEPAKEPGGPSEPATVPSCGQRADVLEGEHEAVVAKVGHAVHVAQPHSCRQRTRQAVGVDVGLVAPCLVDWQVLQPLRRQHMKERPTAIRLQHLQEQRPAVATHAVQPGRSRRGELVVDRLDRPLADVVGRHAQGHAGVFGDAGENR